jgi:hypothetical protein
LVARKALIKKKYHILNPIRNEILRVDFESVKQLVEQIRGKYDESVGDGHDLAFEANFLMVGFIDI